MGKSTFISAALHVAILLWIIVAFPTAKMGSGLVAIPVDLATPSEITKVKAGMKDAKDEGPLAGKPKPPKPQAVREESPKPEQTAEKPKEPEAKPKAEKAGTKPAKTAEAEAPKKPAPRPAPKTRDFNTDRIAALLNKIPDAEDKPAPQTETAKPVHGQSDGTKMSMSINELDALRARIAACWTPPPGGLGADEIVVKLRLKLNEDGTLVGYPTVANEDASPFFQAAADSAVRAVYQCQPYELPKAKYALWRDMILNFDPSAMYRSG